MTDKNKILIDDFKVVEAQDEDLPQILIIWERGLKQIYPDIDISENAIEIFKRNFKHKMYPFNFWVAKSTSVLGWCSILPAFSHPLRQNNSGEVSTYIDVEKSPKGLGTKLMKSVFLELQKSEIENVWGLANPNNLRSIKMCENAGMYICGQSSEKTILVIEFK